jgi:hypothetical protein
MPTTVSTACGQYGTALGNSRKLLRDAYGKYLALYKNGNVRLGYCNNDPPTSGWSDNDFGSAFAVDAGEAFGVAAAYDSTNDKLMVAFVQSSALKLAQVTFTRDGSHNITGYNAGSLLSIAAAYSTIHNPSLWMLHNGEVACVWGDDKTSGAKHALVKFCRVVFGSPPTYKNAAGTANSVDTISTDYTGNVIAYQPSVAERTNGGAGQYDLYATYVGSYSSGWIYRRNKATWSSPNWSWGNEITSSGSASTVTGIYSTLNYDVFNGLFVWAWHMNAASSLARVTTYSSTDVESVITPTLSFSVRVSFSLAINNANGDYYIYYQLSNDVWFLKRTGGSWGSETQFTTSANENYPSCKVDGAGNRIELIWTHYTGGAYNVYYDYLSLGAPPPSAGGVLVQVM